MARSKKQDETTTAALDAAQLAQENAALRAREETILDGLIAMQAEIDKLKAAQTGTSAKVVQQHDAQAELDAELAELAEEFKDYPQIQVFTRRVVVGADANLDIRLRDEPTAAEDPHGSRRQWKLRWFNFGKEGRADQATNEGYVKVRWDELQNQEAVLTDDAQRKDPFVRKGERGMEVLCKIPLKLYEYKKRRDAAVSAGLLSSESRLKDHLANSTSQMAGAAGENADQAGTFVQGIGLTITPGARETATF
jgi:hypothetical protein